jgi:predicted 3-demethylubiquinone-9 3-methyltransferase (glyoxalase superfamily)
MQKIHPCLWFDGQAEDAAKFYTSVFPDSRIIDVAHYGEAGPGEPGSVVTVTFELQGQQIMALNGGPEFHFTEAISLVVPCETQEEVDYYWDKLTEDGEESQCGWLKDKFGLSWQIVPNVLGELLGDEDKDRANAAMKAMLGMRKLDVNALREAADSVGAGVR